MAITVNAVTRRKQYTSSGSLGPYAFSFKILEATSLAVYVGSTKKTVTTHYTTAYNSDGTGSVTFTSGNAPASGAIVTLESAQPIERTSDYTTGGDFKAASINDDLDRLAINDQQLETNLTLNVQLASTANRDTSSSGVGPLHFPYADTASDQANKSIIYDSDGTALTTGPTASEISGAATQATNAASSASTASTSATTSTNYATKVDGAITGTDFSSKAWAIGGTNVTDTAGRGAAKEWATEAEDNTVDGTNYSAKHHATKAAASASSASSSATAAAAGSLYSTVVNQTGSTLSPALSADGTYYLCDTSSNSITVTLPEIGTTEGCKFAFQKTHASNSLIFQRSGSDTLNGSASNITLTDVDAQIIFVSDNASPDNWVGTNLNQIIAGTSLTKTGSVMAVTAGGIGLTQIATAAKTECIAIACSDETTALEAGTAKATFHMPYAFTLTGVKAGVTTAPAGSVLTVDINEAGATILTTKLTIDAGEKTSATAATAAVIGGAGPALAADALMTVDLDGVGSSTAGAGLKVYLIGYQT